MEICKPPLMTGCLRFTQAERDVEEPDIISFDAKAEVVLYLNNRLTLRFNFQLPGVKYGDYYEKNITGEIQENKPFFSNINIYRVKEKFIAIYAQFSIPNVYGEIDNAWEVVGRFRGKLPKEIELWDLQVS